MGPLSSVPLLKSSWGALTLGVLMCGFLPLPAPALPARSTQSLTAVHPLLTRYEPIPTALAHSEDALTLQTYTLR